jgi:hypothetical protein
MTFINGSADLAVQGFKFIAYVYQNGYKGIDGILGLSREFISLSKSTGPLIVKDLLKTKVIKGGVFAFRFNKHQGSSYMDLGSYEQKAENPIYWTQNQPYSQFWQLTINGY